MAILLVACFMLQKLGYTTAVWAPCGSFATLSITYSTIYSVKNLWNGTVSKCECVGSQLSRILFLIEGSANYMQHDRWSFICSYILGGRILALSAVHKNTPTPLPAFQINNKQIHVHLFLLNEFAVVLLEDPQTQFHSLLLSSKTLRKEHFWLL